MEELVSKGMTKAIGISNFTITKTANLLKTAKIVPAVNQGNFLIGANIYIIIMLCICVCMWVCMNVLFVVL